MEKALVALNKQRLFHRGAGTGDTYTLQVDIPYSSPISTYAIAQRFLPVSPQHSVCYRSLLTNCFIFTKQHPIFGLNKRAVVLIRWKGRCHLCWLKHTVKYFSLLPSKNGSYESYCALNYISCSVQVS